MQDEIEIDQGLIKIQDLSNTVINNPTCTLL